MEKIIGFLLETIYCFAIVWFMFFLFFFTGNYRLAGCFITGLILLIFCITEKG